MLLFEQSRQTIEVRESNSLTSIRITGGYVRDTASKQISVILLRARADSNRKIIINCVTEPYLFMDAEYTLSWFEFLHNTANAIGFPAQRIQFVTCNIYAAESYSRWCAENSVTDKMSVVSPSQGFYWITRSIGRGYNKTANVIADRHLSIILGLPRLHKNYIFKWYADNIYNTSLEDRIVFSSRYKYAKHSDPWFETNSAVLEQLPGAIDHGDTSINHWLAGDPMAFNSVFQRSLVDLTVDYVEFENFDTLEDYVNVKDKHTWWQEDLISEKAFRCILLKKPFIRLGMPNSLKLLQSWGYRTFDGILFDESYDSVEDFETRTQLVCDQALKIVNMDFDTLRQRIAQPAVQEILEHNYALAYSIHNRASNNDIFT